MAKYTIFVLRLQNIICSPAATYNMFHSCNISYFLAALYLKFSSWLKILQTLFSGCNVSFSSCNILCVLQLKYIIWHLFSSYNILYVLQKQPIFLQLQYIICHMLSMYKISYVVMLLQKHMICSPAATC